MAIFRAKSIAKISLARLLIRSGAPKRIKYQLRSTTRFFSMPLFFFLHNVVGPKVSSVENELLATCRQLFFPTLSGRDFFSQPGKRKRKWKKVEIYYNIHKHITITIIVITVRPSSILDAPASFGWLVCDTLEPTCAPSHIFLLPQVPPRIWDLGPLRPTWFQTPNRRKHGWWFTFSSTFDPLKELWPPPPPPPPYMVRFAVPFHPLASSRMGVDDDEWRWPSPPGWPSSAENCSHSQKRWLLTGWKTVSLTGLDFETGKLSKKWVSFEESMSFFRLSAWNDSEKTTVLKFYDWIELILHITL